MIRRSWMIGASIETTRELWASSLREVKKRIRPLFAQERAALNAGLFVDGLLGDERRKTGWMRAEAAGDPGPWRHHAQATCRKTPRHESKLLGRALKGRIVAYGS